MLLTIVFGYVLRSITCYGPAGGPGGKAPARATRLRVLPTRRAARLSAAAKAKGSGNDGASSSKDIAKKAT